MRDAIAYKLKGVSKKDPVITGKAGRFNPKCVCRHGNSIEKPLTKHGPWSFVPEKNKFGIATIHEVCVHCRTIVQYYLFSKANIVCPLRDSICLF